MRGLQKPKFGILTFVLVLLLAGTSAASAATILWGTTGSAGGESTLVRLDPDTGAWVQTIGLIGYSVDGLTWDPNTGTLYGSTSTSDPNHNGLIVIDPITGLGTLAGPQWWGLAGPTAITNITVNEAGQMFGWLETTGELVSIDAGGNADVVGSSGLSTSLTGLSFDAADNLYLVNSDGSYYRINTGTGAASPLGSIGVMAHHGDFHPSGLYWGIDTNSGDPRSIVVADLGEGTALNTIPTVDNLHTLTFGEGPDVPEPGTLAMFGLGLAGLAIGRRRKA